jgi:DNA-binding transcriptional regulator GbsR (MarR family)
VTEIQPNVEREHLVSWVERVATFYAEQYGLPPITGRILGWLMICDPPEQSAGEIAEAIGASRASITTNMRLLTATELVHRHTRPGERMAYYRVDDDAWEKIVRRKFASLASFRDIARDGMDLVGADSARAARLRAAHEIYGWLEELLANAPQPPSTKRRSE